MEDNAELEITNDRLEKQTSELSAAAPINTQEKKLCSLVLKLKKWDTLYFHVFTGLVSHSVMEVLVCKYVAWLRVHVAQISHKFLTEISRKNS